MCGGVRVDNLGFLPDRRGVEGNDEEEEKRNGSMAIQKAAKITVKKNLTTAIWICDRNRGGEKDRSVNLVCMSTILCAFLETFFCRSTGIGKEKKDRCVNLVCKSTILCVFLSLCDRFGG